MPFLRRRRRRTRKPLKFRRKSRKVARRYKSRFPRNNQRLTYENNIGIGNSRLVKMTYYEQVGLACTSGLPATYTWNLSSINDPQVAVGGHQAFGHDTFKTLFKKYFVSSATITIKWTNIATNNIPHKCFVMMDRDNATDTNLDTRMEQTKGTGTKTLLANSNNQQVTSLRYVAKRFHKIKNAADDHQIKAQFDADPVLPAYCVMGIQPIDSVSSTSAIIYGEVMINFNVVCFDPVPLTQS